MASSAAAAAAAVAMVPSQASSSSLLSRPHLHPHHQLWRPSLSPPRPSSFPSLSSCPRRSTPRFRAQSDDPVNSAAGSSSDYIVTQVAVLDEEPSTPGVAPPKPRKPSPLERGGTLSGQQAAGKDPSPSALGKSAPRAALTGAFQDARWKNGTWELSQFTKDGKVDWDAVIDAEVLRRKWLEENPEASRNDDPVVFETSVIPWWAWVKRFHLPEAELLNGRAAMVGFFMGYVVDALTGVGLVDQTNSFFGKLLLLITVLGILFIRKNEDVTNLRELVKEWNFYDKQWQATWQEEQPPSSEKEE